MDRKSSSWAPKAYRTTEWQRFRAGVIEADGGACTDCRRSPPEVVLQVHHDGYDRGKKPWEYPMERCRTLCKGCHARGHGKLPPRGGWDYIGEEDLGDRVGRCELCGTEIRYVHLIDHSDWFPMEVGCDCCDRLTGTSEASAEEKRRRNKANRRRTFIRSRKWEDQDGVLAREFGSVRIKIDSDADGYFAELNDLAGRKRFQIQDEAQVFVFDFIDSGEAETYLRRLGRWEGP